MASQDKAVLTYKASNMVLAIHSNASYLSKPKARSRAGGHMFMAGRDDIPTNNGAVVNILQIIRAVMSSAAEAELGALFINAKTAVSMHHTLEELGHPQPPTPIQTDNKTANDLLTNKIMPKALKAIDMHFHWLQCCKAQRQFRYYWRPGTQNLADYFTKHHPASHHKANRPTFLTPHKDPHSTKNYSHRNRIRSSMRNLPQSRRPQQTPSQSHLARIYSKHRGSKSRLSTQSQQKVPKHSYGKGVLELHKYVPK
jgi:hypothetical protein